jgi:two-component system CheB/CheR fusion protein
MKDGVLSAAIHYEANNPSDDKNRRAGRSRSKLRSRVEACPIVGIGASAGGLEAFQRLLKCVPPNTGMAFVLVQHLDPEHESMLSRLLRSSTAMPIAEIQQDMAIEPDHVYVIPPKATLEIGAGMFRLTVRTQAETKHMPIDHFFRSLSENEGNLATESSSPVRPPTERWD